jgi:hypothetical protein
VNAVEHMARQLSREAVRRLAALRDRRFRPGPGHATLLGARPAPAEPPPPYAPYNARRALDNDEAHARVVERWGGDLCGLLNALTRSELAALAEVLGVPARGRSPDLREALWEHGARLEAGGAEVSPALQPRPIVLGGHLVLQAPPRGLYPPASAWPRAVPPAAAPAPPDGEPETLDDLLAAADRTIGVRLGRRGRDKGAWGSRAAALLGIVERGLDEPDWRGDVEVKTVPVGRDPTGRWRVVEDPSIAMLGEPVLAKLQRTLWLVRVTLDDAGRGEDADAAILSWYLLEWDADVARLARRYLHERPKGPAGTSQLGLYLHRRFFADAGLLATLNGSQRSV